MRWLLNSRTWSPSSSQFSYCLSLLPTPQQDEIIRFVKFEDQKRYILSRLMQQMLIHVVFNIPYKEIVISRTKEGKPYVEPCYLNASAPNVNFSVSHHGDYVALASETLCLVGLDIMGDEGNDHEEPEEYIKNFRSYFTVLEWDNINRAGQDGRQLLDQFHRYWCMKESYIKAVGIGIGFELRRAEFFFKDGNIWGDSPCLRLDGIERTDWHFYLFHLRDNHWVCVSKGPPGDAIESFKKTLHTINVSDGSLAHVLKQKDPAFTELTIMDIIPVATLEGQTNLI